MLITLGGVGDGLNIRFSGNTSSGAGGGGNIRTGVGRGRVGIGTGYGDTSSLSCALLLSYLLGSTVVRAALLRLFLLGWCRLISHGLLLHSVLLLRGTRKSLASLGFVEGL